MLIEKQNNLNQSESDKCNEDKKISVKIMTWINKMGERFSRILTFRRHYYLEAQQAFRKVVSEYNVIKSIVNAKQNQTPEDTDTIHEIDSLICEATKQETYSQLWPYIHLIELQLIRLYDYKSLLSYRITVLNNLNALKEADKNRWEKELSSLEEKPDEEYLKRILYKVTSEINEAQRINFMTNDLKRDLMKRFIRITLIIGLLAWVLTFMIVRDSLVHYAIVIGLMGGFFSKILSIQTLEFKPPAFALISLYTYTQPLLGGLGALVLYLILISPIGPEVISGDTFYLDSLQTQHYFQSTIDYKPTIFGIPIPMIIPNKYAASIVIERYPKPGLFLLLSFLAGFSERWLLGTLESIVGKKLKKEETQSDKKEVKPKT